jgi:dihydrodipicolinate reductase
MLITLKQKEIEAALRLYILNRGINLVGKDVTIAFTAGRKEAGLSAEVNIEDDANMVVDFTPPAVDLAATANSLQTLTEQAFNDMLLTGTGITMTAVDPSSVYIAAGPPAQPDPTPEPTPEAEVEPPFTVTAGSKKPGSLFN